MRLLCLVFYLRHLGHLFVHCSVIARRGSSNTDAQSNECNVCVSRARFALSLTVDRHGFLALAKACRNVSVHCFQYSESIKTGMYPMRSARCHVLNCQVLIHCVVVFEPIKNPLIFFLRMIYDCRLW